MKWFYYSLIFLFLWTSQRSYACTVFYICRDGRVLGGSNEDWKDPDTRMWFYPPSDNKHGWIKLGFSGGFPQAGMNDCGIFWDGTSAPWQGMPLSEAQKEKLSEPVMKRIMEDCGSIEEAIALFNVYYCEDQYRGQYLVGGAEGTSVIVEGDFIHQNQFSQQVLTNFHPSNPDLGGYPCWRFNKADDMLASCTSPTPYQMGEVLAETYQEGRYPTQYSIVFDPQEKELYIFYYHNFQEYLVLSLDECLHDDTVSYSIPPIFSRMELRSPENGALIQGDSAILKWKGLPMSTYEVSLTDDEGCLLDKSVINANCTQTGNAYLYYSIIILPLILISRRSRATFTYFLFAVVMLVSSCKKEEPAVAEDPGIEFSYVARDLQPGETYHWKVVAIPEPGSRFQTESVSFSFSCKGLLN